MRDLVRCRTAALGGHLEVCTSPTCSFEQPAYNSCRNRHFPKCQGLSQARWGNQRLQRVLPTHYFHVVFTLPAELHGVVRRNRALVFGLLLRCAADTLLTLGRDPKWLGAGAQLGITTVLHTWTRELPITPSRPLYRHRRGTGTRPKPVAIGSARLSISRTCARRAVSRQDASRARTRPAKGITRRRRTGSRANLQPTSQAVAKLVQPSRADGTAT